MAKRSDSETKERSKVPGPGTYQQMDIIGKEGLSKTISGKGIDLTKKELLLRPGPADYNPDHDKVLRSSPSSAIPKAKRDDNETKKQL